MGGVASNRAKGGEGGGTSEWEWHQMGGPNIWQDGGERDDICNLHSQIHRPTRTHYKQRAHQAPEENNSGLLPSLFVSETTLATLNNICAKIQALAIKLTWLVTWAFQSLTFVRSCTTFVWLLTHPPTYSKKPKSGSQVCFSCYRDGFDLAVLFCDSNS